MSGFTHPPVLSGRKEKITGTGKSYPPLGVGLGVGETLLPDYFWLWGNSGGDTRCTGWPCACPVWGNHKGCPYPTTSRRPPNFNVDRRVGVYLPGWANQNEY